MCIITHLDENPHRNYYTPLHSSFEKQLNKPESANKIGKTVFHDNNQAFCLSNKEEQLIADACHRLIENTISAALKPRH